MKLLKKWARKILKNELDKLNEDARYYKSQAIEFESKYDNLREAKLEAVKTIRERNEKLKELKQENVILKKYYHLYDEPTEEQEIEIRAKLRVRDMQKEIDRYKNMLQPRIYIPEQPVANGVTLYADGVAYRH